MRIAVSTPVAGALLPAFPVAKDQPGKRQDNRPTHHVVGRIDEAANQERWKQDQEHKQGKRDEKLAYAMFCLHQHQYSPVVSPKR
jgi:hypothetical protein